MDSYEVVLKSLKSYLCVCPSGSPCPLSYISVWLHNKPAFMLGRREESAGSTQPTISNRADIQYQATCTDSGATHSHLLSSLSPAHLLCISAFRSPTALRFMSPSLSLLCLRLRWPSLYVYPKSIKLQSCTHTHMRSNMQIHRCLASHRCEIFC